MFLLDVSREPSRLPLGDFTAFLEFCQQDALLPMSRVFILTNKWSHALQARGGFKRALGHASQVQNNCGAMAANVPTSVHHLVPFGRFQHHERTTGLDLQVQFQDPWEVVQAAVTSMHVRDIAHRICLIQDELVGMPVSFRRRGETLQTKLLSLQDGARALENEGQNDEALWNELHWDLIRLKVEISRYRSLQPPPQPLHRRVQKWCRESFRKSTGGR